jgi:uncharacterized protein (TIGR03437 family)
MFLTNNYLLFFIGCYKIQPWFDPFGSPSSQAQLDACCVSPLTPRSATSSLMPGGGNPTFTAKVTIASIPPSQPTFSPDIYVATFTTYPSGVNSSPLDVATITIGQTIYMFNTFAIGIGYTPDTFTGVGITGSQFPPDAHLITFTIGLQSQRGVNLLPGGLPATLPTIAQFPTATFTVNGFSPTLNFSGTIASITSCSAAAVPSPLPAIQPGGVVSAGAFGSFAAVSPGSWIEIYGNNLSATTRSWTGADFTGNAAPISLDGVSVTIGGKQAFIDYVSPGQVNALVPSDVAPGPQQMTVTTAAGVSTPYSITVNPVEPGLLAPANFKIAGVQYAVAVFQDGAYALPVGAISGVTSRPAKPGDIVTLYGVGFGPVSPAIPAGQLAQQSNMVTGNLLMSVGGAPATLPYAGLAPGFTGLYQFNLTVPNVAAGNAALTFTIAGTPGSQTLFLPIAN